MSIVEASRVATTTAPAEVTCPATTIVVTVVSSRSDWTFGLVSVR